jgi:hypothetical protein
MQAHYKIERYYFVQSLQKVRPNSQKNTTAHGNVRNVRKDTRCQGLGHMNFGVLDVKK